MDEKGIDKAVILPLMSAEVVGEPQSMGEVFDICRLYPGRFIPFCDFDVRRYDLDSVERFREVLEQYMARGAKGRGGTDLPRVLGRSPAVGPLHGLRGPGPARNLPHFAAGSGHVRADRRTGLSPFRAGPAALPRPALLRPQRLLLERDQRRPHGRPERRLSEYAGRARRDLAPALQDLSQPVRRPFGGLRVQRNDAGPGLHLRVPGRVPGPHVDGGSTTRTPSSIFSTSSGFARGGTRDTSRTRSCEKILWRNADRIIGLGHRGWGMRRGTVEG